MVGCVTVIGWQIHLNFHYLTEIFLYPSPLMYSVKNTSNSYWVPSLYLTTRMLWRQRSASPSLAGRTFNKRWYLSFLFSRHVLSLFAWLPFLNHLMKKRGCTKGMYILMSFLNIKMLSEISNHQSIFPEKKCIGRTLTCSFSNWIIFLKKSTENGRLSCKLKRRGLLSSAMTENLLHLMNINTYGQCLHNMWFNKDLATIRCKNWTWPPVTLNAFNLQWLNSSLPNSFLSSFLLFLTFRILSSLYCYISRSFLKKTNNSTSKSIF